VPPRSRVTINSDALPSLEANRGDFLRETADFSFSTDGKTFRGLGGAVQLVFQLKTFQGVRYALFAFNDGGAAGGRADFDTFTVDEPHPRGLMRPIPLGRSITLTAHDRGVALGVKDGALAAVPADAASAFTVIDVGLGRVALRAADGRLITVERDRVALVRGDRSPATTFQWIENVYGDLILLSLSSHRYLRIDPTTGAISADQPGPAPDRRDGVGFDWNPGERSPSPRRRRKTGLRAEKHPAHRAQRAMTSLRRAVSVSTVKGLCRITTGPRPLRRASTSCSL